MQQCCKNKCGKIFGYYFSTPDICTHKTKHTNKNNKMETQYFFNTTKVNAKLYYVKTNYNEFQIMLDENKGIGIYMMCDTGILIKQYNHLKIETAFNYLMKKYTNFVK